MKTVAIIQARMSSTRLPGKVLADILGKPLLYYVVTRTRMCPLLDEVVVATGDHAPDDAIEEFCRSEGFTCMRGDPDDVLKRYSDAAQMSGADVIVRITADCPLIDPEVVGKTVAFFTEGGYDYASNEIERTYPHGLDTEVFTRAALDRSDREASLPGEREHVTRYICEHPQIFRIGSLTNDEDHSHFRWVVDNPEDLELVRAIYTHFGSNHFSWGDLLKAFEKHPEWRDINRNVAQAHVYT